MLSVGRIVWCRHRPLKVSGVSSELNLRTVGVAIIGLGLATVTPAPQVLHSYWYWLRNRGAGERVAKMKLLIDGSGSWQPKQEPARAGSGQLVSPYDLTFAQNGMDLLARSL